MSAIEYGNRRLWLSWETQRRNHSLSRALGARLVELDYELPRWRRYPRAILDTLRVLRTSRPELLFAQNPSLTLALFSVWYGRLSGTPVVIDAHNAGVEPFAGRRRWANGLARHVMRMAGLTLVTNRALADVVDRAGGRSFVLPDPLPMLARAREPLAGAGPTVLFVCSWAADEPYRAVLEAAERLDASIRLYITGNSKGRERCLGRPLPPGVVLTGFVPDSRYVELLHAADVVMDLTTRENCLVCGAYEAVAAGKPMVLSDTPALRRHFHRGAVYAKADPAAIAAAIERAIAERGALGAAVVELASELRTQWAGRREALEALLSQTAAKPDSR